MASLLENVLHSRRPADVKETKLALREILQDIVLIGLSRANFFSKASFYGGTALRIFYGLNRYSEDLDFTLNETDRSFSLEPYMKSIVDLASSYGLEIKIETKIKKLSSPIESAFAKLNTYRTFIHAKLDRNLLDRLHKDEVLKVKFEVDCDPAIGFHVHNKWITDPELAPINVLDLESLFAGKLHAILCRNYKNNVKGRDYYDFVFFINKGTKPNLIYLKNKLVASGALGRDAEFDINILKGMLLNRFNRIDFRQVREDAEKFTTNNEDLSFYCKELFVDCLNRL